MRKEFPNGGMRPTESQALLLQAALLEGEPALEAWRAWEQRENLEVLDAPSERLIGLLWRNLHDHGVNHPKMAKMKGVYRHTWYHNQTVLRGAGQPLRILREAGIPTIVLKGAALTALYYSDTGLRRMEDVDLLVPVERAADALAAMRASGCRAPSDRAIRAWYAGVCAAPDESWNVDLHWYSLWRSASDENFWAHAQPMELGGEETLALCPTHQLLHVCAHGSEWGEVAPIRWIPDAHAILSQTEIDWDLFVEEASQRILTVMLAPTLEYLRELIHAPVPVEVISRLRDVPVPAFAQAGWRSTCRPYSLGRTLRVVWERYRRLRALRPPGPKPLGPISSYYRFVEFQWKLDGPWQLPGHVVRWAFTR